MMRSLLVLIAVVAALFFITVQCAPKEFSLYKQEPARSPIRVFETIGGRHLLGRIENGRYNLQNGQLTSKYIYPEQIDWDILLARNLDSIGGSNLLGRSLDSIGGSHLLGRDAMPGDIGTGYRHRSLDAIGGNNLLGRDAMPGDIGSVYQLRSLDGIGGSNLLGRELDDIGGGNLIGRDAMPCDIGC